MKTAFIEAIKDIAPVILITSVSASFIKGAKTIREYIKALMASYLVGIPAAFLVEYLVRDPEAQMLKYTVVITFSTFGICSFNGLFKIFKHFEESPEDLIEEIKNGKHQ